MVGFQPLRYKATHPIQGCGGVSPTAFGAVALMVAWAAGGRLFQRAPHPFPPLPHRFISGKEIKKRKGLFGLHLRVPPPAPQAPETPGPPLLLLSESR